MADLVTRPTDARLREIASGALAVRSPLELTLAEQRAVAKELIEARALLRDIQRRDGMDHTADCWADFPGKWCTCGLNRLEGRIAAALNEEAADE